LYSEITSVAPIKDVERKILLIPIIFMLISAASFFCDLYFYFNHSGLDVEERKNGGIIFVHFLIVRTNVNASHTTTNTALNLIFHHLQ